MHEPDLEWPIFSFVLAGTKSNAPSDARPFSNVDINVSSEMYCIWRLGSRIRKIVFDKPT